MSDSVEMGATWEPNQEIGEFLLRSLIRERFYFEQKGELHCTDCGSRSGHGLGKLCLVAEFERVLDLVAEERGAFEKSAAEQLAAKEVELSEERERVEALGRALLLWQDWESSIGKAGWERVPQCGKALAAAKAGGVAFALLPEATLAKVKEAK